MEDQILFLCLLVFFVGALAGEAAQCMPDSKNLCASRCNGTFFDLSKAFDFPLNISEPGPRIDGRTYWYLWNPCHIEECPGYDKGTDCAICQKANLFYNCGQTSEPIWLKDDSPRTKYEDFPDWEIQYTDGTTWRITIFKFIVDHKMKKPTVKFISEDPYLQYNFEVRGKCIGQYSFDCQQYYQSRASL